MAPPPDARKYAAQLKAGRWFSELSPRFQEGLLLAAQVRRLAPDERLFARGDPPTGLYALVEGALRVTAVTEGGKEMLLTRMEAPGWLGEIAIFDRQPRTHDCLADGEAVVLHVPLQKMDALLAEEPLRWRELGLLVAGKLRLSFLAMEDAAALPLAARVARRLVVLAEGHGEWVDKKKRVLDLRQEQLASMLSASRQSANQVLKELEAKGLVRVTRGQVEILDLAALKEL